jgi:hypothetical protein
MLGFERSCEHGSSQPKVEPYSAATRVENRPPFWQTAHQSAASLRLLNLGDDENCTASGAVLPEGYALQAAVRSNSGERTRTGGVEGCETIRQREACTRRHYLLVR